MMKLDFGPLFDHDTKMTYTVSGGALNSDQSNLPAGHKEAYTEICYF